MSDESNREKAERYLKMATETAAQAQRSGDPDVAEAYLQLASVWLRMAEELSGRFAANDDPEAGPAQRGDEAQASA